VVRFWPTPKLTQCAYAACLVAPEPVVAPPRPVVRKGWGGDLQRGLWLVRHSLVKGFWALTRGSRPQPHQPLCAPVAMDIPHLALDNFTEVAGGMDEVPVARVDAHVVPRLQLAVLVLVKEH
jgi:hypothetical protein